MVNVVSMKKQVPSSSFEPLASASTIHLIVTSKWRNKEKTEENTTFWKIVENVWKNKNAAKNGIQTKKSGPMLFRIGVGFKRNNEADKKVRWKINSTRMTCLIQAHFYTWHRNTIRTKVAMRPASSLYRVPMRRLPPKCSSLPKNKKEPLVPFYHRLDQV